MAKSGLNGYFVGVVRSDLIDGNMWQLHQDEENRFRLVIDGIGTIQPANGFYFDFASIPIPARWIYPKTGGGPHGQYGPGAVIHDWLHTTQQINGEKIPRDLADRIFLLGMELKGVRPSMRALFYSAVRIGGGRYFGRPERLNKLRGIV